MYPWKITAFSLAIFFTMALLPGCHLSNTVPEDLPGSWSAIGYVVNNEKDSLTTDTIRNNLDAINLHLTTTGDYAYQGGFSTREAGHFQVSGEKILLVDTINNQSAPRYLIFKQTSPDTLLLSMKNEAGKSMLLLLKTQKARGNQ